MCMFTNQVWRLTSERSQIVQRASQNEFLWMQTDPDLFLKWIIRCKQWWRNTAKSKRFSSCANAVSREAPASVSLGVGAGVSVWGIGYNRNHWKSYTPPVHQIQKLKFSGTNANGRAASRRTRSCRAPSGQVQTNAGKNLGPKFRELIDPGVYLYTQIRVHRKSGYTPGLWGPIFFPGHINPRIFLRMRWDLPWWRRQLRGSSNSAAARPTKISFWICTMRYREIWVSRFVFLDVVFPVGTVVYML